MSSGVSFAVHCALGETLPEAVATAAYEFIIGPLLTSMPVV